MLGVSLDVVVVGNCSLLGGRVCFCDVGVGGREGRGFIGRGFGEEGLFWIECLVDGGVSSGFFRGD